MIKEIIICLRSSHSILFSLLTDKKSSDRKIPVTPFIDKIFLINSLSVLFLSVISVGVSLDTVLPGKNFKEFGFGVISVCTSIISI